MKVLFNNLKEQWNVIENVAQEKVINCFKNCNYILGKEINEFESNFAKYIGTKFAVAVSNGTDAITLMLKALNLKDSTAFYVSSNTFVATTFGISHSYPNASIFLIETSTEFLMSESHLEEVIKKNHKMYKNNIIFPVHMYGNIGDMNRIKKLAKTYNCILVEDCSQSHGTLHISNKKAGTFGKVSAFSLYPGKNLGACGDAGIITTNNKNLYKRMCMLRNLGSLTKYKHEIVGYNNRLDTIQAIILNEKLNFLDIWNKERNKVADFYNQNIKNDLIILPTISPFCKLHSYHIYNILVKNRTKFISYLKSCGIEYTIHYPTPIELMKPYKHLNQKNKNTRFFCKNQISLPIHPFMKLEEISYVVNCLNNFK